MPVRVGIGGGRLHHFLFLLLHRLPTACCGAAGAYTRCGTATAAADRDSPHPDDLRLGIASGLTAQCGRLLPHHYQGRRVLQDAGRRKTTTCGQREYSTFCINILYCFFPSWEVSLSASVVWSVTNKPPTFCPRSMFWRPRFSAHGITVKHTLRHLNGHPSKC